MAESAKINCLRAPFLLLSVIWISSMVPFVLEGQNNEIQDFISNNIPVNNQNWEIYQNPVNRYLYFANSAGLVEYNGITSRNY